MSDMLEMAERIAEVEEMERLRVEVRELRAENERLGARIAFDAEVRDRQRWLEAQRTLAQAMRPMSDAELARYASQSMSGPPSALFGNALGTRWP